MQPIKSITFAVNDSKPGASGTAQQLSELAQNEGVKTKIVSDYPLPNDALIGQDL